MKKKNKDIEVKVETVSNEGLKIDKTASMKFVDDLIETFKEESTALEANRLVNAPEKNSELDLILNDEEHSSEHEVAKRFNHLLD